jgi:hypothetical protein
MAKFTAAQLAVINRRSKPKEVDPAEAGGELNIIPFLDIVMNVLMFVLASIATVFTATIPVPAPSSSRSGRPGAQAEGLSLTVQVLQDGYAIGARGGFLAPGCRDVAGRGTIGVPNLGQPDAEGRRHDFAGLTRCMQSIRQQFAAEVAGEDGHNINISVNALIPYGVLVGTIDAVRESREGACRLPEGARQGDYTNPDCMFPKATLGVLQNR